MNCTQRTTARFVPLVMWLMFFVGCSEPKIARENLRLTMALRTAISARNADWLVACREQATAKHTAGEMSDEEYERFQEVFAQVAADQWEAAERDVVAWQRAQRP